MGGEMTFPLCDSGARSQELRQLSSGLTVSCFKPTLPPVIPTPDTLLNGIIACKCDVAFSVPSLIEVGASAAMVSPAVLISFVGLGPHSPRLPGPARPQDLGNSPSSCVQHIEMLTNRRYTPVHL